jgi:hypothetical protein
MSSVASVPIIPKLAASRTRLVAGAPGLEFPLRA